MNLTKLRIVNEARNKIWDPKGQLTSIFFLNELGGEVGETCNILKKLDRERMGLRGSRITVEQLVNELADCIICLDLSMLRRELPPLDLGAGNGKRAAENLLAGETPSACGFYLFRATGEYLARPAAFNAWALRNVIAALANKYAPHLDFGNEVVRKFNETTQKHDLNIYLEEGSLA